MDKNRQQFDQEIEKLLSRDQIKREEPLSRHTTFRVGGAAEYYVTPTIAQLPDVVALCRQCELPLTVIGNGSNLLVSDAGLRGVVLELGKAASGIRLLDGEDLLVKAGTLLSETASFAAKHGLAGMEFAAGIPGSLGGAVVMNAGAYGGEMKDILSGVRVLTKTGEIKVRPADELARFLLAHLGDRAGIDDIDVGRAVEIGFREACSQEEAAHTVRIVLVDTAAKSGKSDSWHYLNPLSYIMIDRAASDAVSARRMRGPRETVRHHARCCVA